MADEGRETFAVEEPQAAGPDASDGAVALDADAPERLIEKITALQDRYLRLQADFDNYRRRVQRTTADAVRGGRAEVLRAFLPVADNLARALASVDARSSDAASILAGRDSCPS